MSWKLSCPVLRGGESGDARTLPDYLDLEDIDSCILRSGIYWELNKSKVDSSRKIRVTKDSVMNPHPLHLDRPFTWIFTAKCSENSLRRWNAIPDPEFGAHVYRLAAPGLSMGIVDLESLDYKFGHDAAQNAR
jgi:hypothetical protein